MARLHIDPVAWARGGPPTGPRPRAMPWSPTTSTPPGARPGAGSARHREEQQAYCDRFRDPGHRRRRAVPP